MSSFKRQQFLQLSELTAGVSIYPKAVEQLKSQQELSKQVELRQYKYLNIKGYRITYILKKGKLKK